jgi:hypothetical protein
MAVSCEHGNKYLDPIKIRNFLIGSATLGSQGRLS